MYYPNLTVGSVQYKGVCAREYVNFITVIISSKFGYIKSCVECISFLSYENVSKIKTSQLQYKISFFGHQQRQSEGFMGKNGMVLKKDRGRGHETR